MLVHEAIADELIERVRGAVDVLQVGPGRRLRDAGPAADRAGRAGASARLPGARGPRGAAVHATRGRFRAGDGSCRRRWLTDLPAGSSGARGRDLRPAAAIERVPGVEAACDIVDGLDYALTGGLFSRNPEPSSTSRLTHARRQPLRQPPDHRSDGRDASRSAATGCRARASRPAAPTTCGSSPIRRSSRRTRCGTGSWCDQATSDDYVGKASYSFPRLACQLHERMPRRGERPLANHAIAAAESDGDGTVRCSCCAGSSAARARGSRPPA